MKIIHQGITYEPLEVSQDGYQVRILIDVQILTLTLGVDFTYEHPCRSCGLPLMPCCGRCRGAGHDERCEGAKEIRARMRGR